MPARLPIEARICLSSFDKGTARFCGLNCEENEEMFFPEIIKFPLTDSHFLICHTGRCSFL